MKSICIKTNNEKTLNYLLNELRSSKFSDVCFSQNEFFHYKNVIIHYLGLDTDSFIHAVSDMLSYLVIDELEESFLKDIISHDYCYFDNIERNKILDFCFDICSDDFTNYFDKKFSYLSKKFYNYLNTNKSIVLTGFIYFRLKDYFDILNQIVEEAVNSFIIEKEYLEFISLLKLYINSQKTQSDVLHLIYSSNKQILLDNQMNIIPFKDNSFDAKYLSDISFSNNDYILNTLLNLLPKRLYIHLIDNNIDEFVNTLILIFEKKAEVCTDCNICALYKNKKMKKNGLSN